MTTTVSEALAAAKTINDEQAIFGKLFKNIGKILDVHCHFLDEYERCSTNPLHNYQLLVRQRTLELDGFLNGGSEPGFYIFLPC